MAGASINYLAVLVCALVSLGLGLLWYSPFLFGKIWIESIDKTEEEIEKENNPFKTYPLLFLAQLVMAYVLARMMVYADATTLAEGVRIAFLGWIGFTAATMFANSIFEGTKLKKLGVDSGYHLVVFLTYGAILGIWHS
ncbi:MAG: DUF1761 domain-containing protein [Ignavibacteria bacterium]|jgi:hypothetical protein|nr:DUF1761 domain-containing protein [Ignavibacteria bacterium]